MTSQSARDRRTWVEPEIWYARLATQYAATGALITDPAGRVLLVKPNYRDHWLLPGGMVDDGETPEDACARELKEELGLDLTAGRLLVVDWAPPRGKRPRPIAYFLFDCGTIDDPDQIRLQDDELDNYAFLDLDEATTRLLPIAADRLPAAVAARTANTTIYLPQARGAPALG
jgi:ADP-ribose pyrophosphatase YjhB (NUDIX family)